MQYFLADSIVVDKVLMYGIVIFLILLNIAFIVLFIVSVARNNNLEEKIEAELIKKSTKEIIMSDYDKEISQPINNRPKADTAKKYIIEENEKKDGFYIKEKGKTTPLAFTKTKDEATEIVKQLNK